MIENIPQEMIDRNQWVVHTAESKKKPINALTLGNAMPNNPNTWTTFDNAVKIVNSGKALGVGYVFNDDYIAIDLDDCLLENKKAKPWASEIMKSLYPCYMEYSISGKGIHIFSKRHFGLPGKNLQLKFKDYNLYDCIGGIEIYQKFHYFIVTGNVIKGCTEILDKEPEIIPLYIKYQTMADRATEKKQKSSIRNIDTTIFTEVNRTVTMEQVLNMYGIRIGRDHKICCPFHKEEEPSMMIYEYDYYCFGCKDYGDAVSFVMKQEKLPNNYEAAKLVAEKFNLQTSEPIKNLVAQSKAKTNILTALPEEIESWTSKGLNVADIKPYDKSKAEIVKTGIPTLDKMINLEMGQVTLWTGLNSAGKSTVLGQVMVESIEQNYNVFAFSGELIANKFQYWIDLQCAGANHLTQKTSNTTGSVYYEINHKAKQLIHEWYNQKFWLYDNTNGTCYEDILKVMTAFAVYKKCRVFLIDNLMRLDLSGINKDQYVAQSQFVNSVSNFAQTYNVLVHLVAHPRKPPMSSIITKMDVAGSADLTNRADNVLAVHRVTEQFRTELKKIRQEIKGSEFTALTQASNAIEIFKNRDGEEQDIMLPLQYCSGSKRIIDVKHPELKDKKYSWDKTTELKQDKFDDCPF